MAWPGRRRARAGPTLEQLRGWHLLLLPHHVTAAQVDALVRCRYPDARLADTHRARLGRQSAISGPHRLGAAELDAVHVPPTWPVVYALEVGQEPDPAAFDDIADPVLRAWWMRAFPLGKPFREEGDGIDLALALARRLGGALRAAGSNVVLQPDHARLLDLTVWSGYWLEPDRLWTLLDPVLPGARVDRGGRAWARPPVSPARRSTPWSVDPLDPFGVDLEHALGEDDHELIRAVSDETDTAALAVVDVVDGFSLTADGDLVVEVTQEDAVPAWVRARVGHQLRADGDPVVSYVVRWQPEDLMALESEAPPYMFRRQRDRVRLRLQAATLAIAEATAGVVSDAAGFEVDRYGL